MIWMICRATKQKIIKFKVLFEGYVRKRIRTVSG